MLGSILGLLLAAAVVLFVLIRLADQRIAEQHRRFHTRLRRQSAPPVRPPDRGERLARHLFIGLAVAAGAALVALAGVILS